MPFKSQAQSRYMFANHPELAEEFQKKTLNIKALPEHMMKKKDMKKMKDKSMKGR